MEGNQVVMLLLKLLSQLANQLGRLMEKALVAYLRHRQHKRELGLKKGKVLKHDKAELLIAKTLKKNLAIKEKTFEEKVRVAKFKLDCYKLEMQSELAEFEKNIRILTSGLETAKDEVSKEMIQKQLHKAITEKTNFEKEVNRTLLERNKELNKLESDYNRIKENIKICDKAIDGFASNRAKDITESTRNDFESLVKQESLTQSKESFQYDKVVNKEHDKDFKSKEQDKEIVNEIETMVKVEVTNQVINEVETGIEKQVDREFVNEVDKRFVDNHEKEPAKFEKEPIKSEKSKDDEFMKEYLEKQKRKSLAKDRQQDLALEI